MTQTINTVQLPVKINAHGDALEAANAMIKSWGLELQGTKLFCTVEAPEGWEVVRTDHHLWTHLLDDLGRRRMTIFYKSAFYDTDAFLNVCPRFRVFHSYGYEFGDEKHRILITDGNKRIWSGRPFLSPDCPEELERGSQEIRDWYDARDAKMKERVDAAREILLRHHPYADQPIEAWEQATELPKKITKKV